LITTLAVFVSAGMYAYSSVYARRLYSDDALDIRRSVAAFSWSALGSLLLIVASAYRLVLPHDGAFIGWFSLGLFVYVCAVAYTTITGRRARRSWDKRKAERRCRAAAGFPVRF
jgi:hypothetical protein